MNEHTRWRGAGTVGYTGAWPVGHPLAALGTNTRRHARRGVAVSPSGAAPLPRGDSSEETLVRWKPRWTRSPGAWRRLAIGAALAAPVVGGGMLVGRSGQAAAAPESQVISVRIYADRIDPAQLTLEAQSIVLLEVANQTRVGCTFYIQGLLTGLIVPAAGHAHNSLEVPNLPPSADTVAGASTGGPSDSGSVVVPMGCRGSSHQQGTAIVQRQPGT